MGPRDKTSKNATIYFFAFTILIANVCFYYTIRRTIQDEAKLNIQAIVFNIFFIMLLISIIKILKKTPNYLSLDEEELAKHWQDFCDSHLESRPNKESFREGTEEFQLYLNNYGLKLCEKCWVIKVG